MTYGIYVNYFPNLKLKASNDMNVRKKTTKVIAAYLDEEPLLLQKKCSVTFLIYIII